MGEKDPEPADESTERALSLPSLGFGRKRREAPADPEPAEVEADATTEQAEVDADTATEQPEIEADTRTEQPAAAAAAPTRAQERIGAAGWGDITGAYDAAHVGTPASQEDVAADRKRDRTRRSVPRPSVSLPTLSVSGLTGRVAAGVVGLLAGLLMVGGTMAAMQGCDLVRGTSSCGGGLGFLVLLAVAAGVVVAAAVGLRIAGVAYPGTISFLGVGLVVVVVLLVLLDVIFTVWMLAVIPVLCGAAFVLAHGLSVSFGEWNGPDWR